MNASKHSQWGFQVVVAADEKWGIGKLGTLPWRLPSDTRHFVRLTRDTAPEGQRNAVLMGRKTWESIPRRFRPLDGRLNVVISRNADYALPEGVGLAGSLDSALQLARAQADVHSLYVIGGGSIYAEAVARDDCRRVHLTRVKADCGCDVFFPDITATFALRDVSDIVEERGLAFDIAEYVQR